MKKAILIGLLALISGFGVAQRHIYFQEGFISDGERYTVHEELWDQSDLSGLHAMYFTSSHEAGGEAPEALWGYYPDYGLSDKLEGTYRLIFKKYKMLSNHNNYVSVKYYYESNRNSAMDVRVFGLAARKAGGAWQVCRQINTMTKNLGQGQLVAELPEEMRESFDIQVCVFYTTPKDNAYYLLYVDDIEFFAYPDNDYAVDVAWAGEPFTATGRLNVGLAVKNAGNKMDSCEISYTLDGGAVHTLPLTFSNGLMPDETSMRSFFSPEDWNETAYGKHTVEFWLSKANGTAIADDKIQKQVKYLTNLDPATSQLYQFRPLVEHFSASTCPPCANLNAVMNPVYADMGDTISLIKYQMDFPGNGDPYYTMEGVERRLYYGVNSVPTVVLDGSALTLSGNTYADVAANLKKAMLKATDKQVYYGMWFDTLAVDADQNIRVTLKVKAVGGVENVILHTVVEEGTTYGNVGSNGETEFHNVMMKMLPDANGVKLSLEPDTVYTFTYAYDMTKTHMEEFTDLRVICFLQTESGNILQSVAGKAGAFSGAGATVKVDYVPAYLCAEDVPAGLRLICSGSEPLTSVEIEGKVGAAGTPVAQTYDVSMEWGGSTYVALEGLKVAEAKAGADTVFFTVTKVNGEAFDGQPLRYPVYVQPTQNAFLPAVEGFTNATNRGCATLNSYLDALEGVCLMRFPMKGDKYTRPQYTRYAAKMGVENAPGLALNGRAVDVDAEGELPYESYFEALLAQSRKSNSIMQVGVSDNVVVKGNSGAPSVVANLNFESPVDVSCILYAFVVETVTEKNTGTNGETQFKRVVQALFPDENGAKLNIRNGKGIYVLSRAILTPKVENFDNLKLVVIVKDATGKEVLQTAEFPILNQVPNEGLMAYETLAVYPNPASESVYLKALENATVDVFDLTGVKVFGLNGVSGDYTLDVRSYVPGAYIIKVSEGAKVSTARISVVR